MAETNPPAVDAAAGSTAQSPEPVASHADTTKTHSSAAQPALPTTTEPEPTAAAVEKKDAAANTYDKSSLEPALAVPTAAEKEIGLGSVPRSSNHTDNDDDDDDDAVNPPDFRGAVLSDDELPSPETISRIGEYAVLDRYGKTHTFKSLYTGRNVARRVLIIFVRHFYCGNCQEYLRTLAASIKPDSLLHLPISTFIAVIGCGDPGLIDMYTEATGCPFPIYADPTRKIYEELGMVKTLALGQRPAYMNKSMLKSSLDSIVQGVKQIRSGLAIKGGDQRQIGGEFLFEPVDIRSPDGSPVQEFDRKLKLNETKETEKAAALRRSTEAAAAHKHSRTTSTTDNDNDEIEEPWLVEDKKVTWCHRMRTTRDHAEIPELIEVLGLTGHGKPIKDQKRWSKALETRKGTGLSMASQMGQMGKKTAAGEI